MIKPRIGFGFILLLLIVVGLVAGCQPSDGGDGAQAPVPEQSPNAPNRANPEGESPANSNHAAGEADDAGDHSADAEQNHTNDQQASALQPDVDLADVTAVRLVNHKTGWIGGEGWIAYSDNGGTEWEVQAQLKGTVRQIFALNGKQAWTVMENNDLYRTTNGGQTWDRIGSTPNGDFLHFISPESGFSGQAITEDGGKTWSEKDIPDTTLGEDYFHEYSTGYAGEPTDDKSL